MRVFGSTARFHPGLDQRLNADMATLFKRAISPRLPRVASGMRSWLFFRIRRSLEQNLDLRVVALGRFFGEPTTSLEIALFPQRPLAIGVGYDAAAISTIY